MTANKNSEYHGWRRLPYLFQRVVNLQILIPDEGVRGGES
jgi:hypothetical protein